MSINLEFYFAKKFFSEQWAKISYYRMISLRVIKNDSSPVNSSIHYAVLRDTQSPVGNMYFQPEASIHIYGALTAAVLSKTYSGVYQLKYELT